MNTMTRALLALAAVGTLGACSQGTAAPAPAATTAAPTTTEESPTTEARVTRSCTADPTPPCVTIPGPSPDANRLPKSNEPTHPFVLDITSCDSDYVTGTVVNQTNSPATVWIKVTLYSGPSGSGNIIESATAIAETEAYRTTEWKAVVLGDDHGSGGSCRAVVDFTT